jgi:hypothetical protein
LITLLYGLFIAFGVLAIVGLYGRLSCFITSALGFYLLTLPQLFGKINHDHNLILFAFVLAACPCCDALSVDAIRVAWGAGRSGTYTPAPRESTVYAAPLKSMMILIGLIYFFPGAWKVGRLGVHWFSVDNMRWTMARKLLETPHISPIQAFALHHSFLLLAGSAFTPLFELGFIFAVFSRRTRIIAAACGIAFHNLTGLLMDISFVSLQVCYVVFVDWTRVLSWISSRLRSDQIKVTQIGRSALPILNVVANFDWLNLVSIETPRMSSASEGVPNRDVHRPTVIDEAGARLSGYDAYLSIMKRIVFLWPVYLFLSMALPRKTGISICEHFQRSREGQYATMIMLIPVSHPNPRIGLSFRLLSGTFMIGMILAGLSHSVNAWPIACYPTFDHLETGQVNELSATATGYDGHIYHQTLSFDPKMESDLAAERYEAMTEGLMTQDAPVSKERAAALVNFWREEYKYPNFKEVTLYADTYTFDPDGKLGRLVKNREVAHLDKSDGLE